jgi:hypothetical protein
MKMTRNGMIQIVKEYFDSNGGPMTAQEYKYAPDAPIKLNVLNSKIGSWGKILKMAGVQKPTPITPEETTAAETKAEVKLEVELKVELEAEPEAKPVVEAPKTAKKK